MRSSTSRSSFPERPSSGRPWEAISSGWLQTCFSCPSIASTAPRRSNARSCCSIRGIQRSTVARYRLACSTVSRHSTLAIVIGGSSSSTSGASFARRRTNGPTSERSRSSARASRRASIGRANVRSNDSREPRSPGLTRSMIAQSSPSRFSIGVPVSASVRLRGIRRSARCRFVARVLRVLRLVEQQPVPGDVGEQLDVARRDVVRRDDDVARAGRVDERPVREARGAVVEVDREPGREAGDLAHPLLDDAHRADDERRPDLGAGLLALGDERRDRLHGLPEAHVVRQDPARPEVAEQPQPAVAALLEREEVVPHPGGRRERPEAALVRPGEELVEAVVERTSPSSTPASSVSSPADGADEVDDAGGAAAAVQEPERALDLRSREARATCPRSRISGSFAAASSRSSSSRELDVADREPPVEGRDRVPRQEPAGGRRRAGRDEVDADAARRRDPLAREPHRARRAPRAAAWPRAEERAHLVGVEPPATGGSPSRTMPASARTGLDRREPAVEGAAAGRSRAGSANTSSAPSVRSDAGRARVGSSAASSHSSSTTGGASAPPAGLPALVEAQPEVPRRARPTGEAAVDPGGEAPLERRVAGAGRQLRPRAARPARKCSAAPALAAEGRTARRPPRAARAARARRRHTVEVVDERLRVAVERLGRSRRDAARGDRVELRRT